jgi:hypothetical protein
VKANAGVALSTGPATATCNVERDRYEVTDFEILDVTPFLYYFAGDLVSEHHAGRRRRTTPHHVLVGAADIGRDDLEDDAVINRLSRWIAERRKVDLLNFDAAWFEVDNTAVGVGSHLQSPQVSPVLHFDVLSLRGRSGAEARWARTAIVPPIAEVWMDLKDDFGRLATVGAALRKFYGGIRPGTWR